MKKTLSLIIITVFACAFFYFGCDNKNPQNFESAKMEKAVIAQKILQNSITDEELESQNFNKKEILDIIIEVGILQGRSKEETMRILEEIQAEIAAQQLNKITSACKQNVEKQNGTQGQTYAFGYYKDAGCDDNPDQDWTLKFATGGAAPDPDKVRWWASWYVRTIFTQVYGGNILACELCSYPRKLLFGTNGVTLAGGINNVKIISIFGIFNKHYGSTRSIYFLLTHSNSILMKFKKNIIFFILFSTLIILIIVVFIFTKTIRHQNSGLSLDMAINHLNLANKISENPSYGENLKQELDLKEDESSMDFMLIVFLAAYLNNSMNEDQIIEMLNNPNELVGFSAEEKVFLIQVLRNEYFDKAHRISSNGYRYHE